MNKKSFKQQSMKTSIIYTLTSIASEKIYKNLYTLYNLFIDL